MRITVAIGLGLALAANGLLMLLDPAGWYALAPGVPETGPLNLHFVRDIGCAYILTGLALAGLAFNERAWPAALIGALLLTLHALVHVADGFSGQVHANHVLTVYAPATIAACSRVTVAGSPVSVLKRAA
jgi:hypothetical protein